MESEKTHTNRARLCLGVLFMTSATLAPAAESEPQMQHELTDYVVVATRTPIPLERVSPSVEYIDREDMDSWQDFYLTDVLARQPGINLKSNGGKGAAASLFLRGANSDQTALFLDGRRMNRTMSGQYDLEFLNVDNLSSVQIQKGASSVNYGSSGIGGVINLQNRSALGPSAENGNLHLETGANNFRKASLAYQISREDFGLSLSHSRLETDNERPNDGLKSHATNFRMDARLAPQLTAELLGQYNKNEKRIPGSITSPSPNAFTESLNWLLSPGLRYEGNNYKVHAFYSREYFRLDDNSYFGFTDKNRLTTDEFNLQIDYLDIDRLTLSLGALHRYEKIQKPDTYLEKMRQTGAFFQALWQLNDALELRGGLRYEDYSDYENDWSWNLEAIYFVPDTNLSVFTKVARAYSPPNGLDIAYDANKDANNNPVNTPLNPEESLSFEFGLRQKLLDDKLEWTAVLFRNEVDNLIEYVSYPSIDTDPSNDPGQPNEDSTADLWDDVYPTDTYNAKEATLEGAEFSVDYRLNPQLRLNLGYTYLTAVAEKYISANSRFEEIRLPYRPRHLLQVSARYQPNKNLNLGLSAVSQMDRQRDQWQDYNKPTEDYFVLNFVSEYRLDDAVSLLARVENLLDEDYALTYNYPALGRSIYFGVRMQF